MLAPSDEILGHPLRSMFSGTSRPAKNHTNERRWYMVGPV